MSVLLYSCKPDSVRPKGEEPVDGPTLGLASNDTHALYTPFCSEFDTLSLMSELGSSLNVNFNCTTNCPPWGYVSTYNSNNYFVAKFRLAQNWFVDFANSEFSIASSFTLGTNGIPQTSNDWFSYNPSPDLNSWQMVVPLDGIVRTDENCFLWAARLSVWTRSFFGGFNPASRRTLWVRNADWNVAGHENNSPSQFLTPHCWAFCPPDADTVCVPFFTGLPTNVQNCATIAAPDVSGIYSGAVSYEWSTGATTPSITVCGGVASSYMVTITQDPSRIPVAVYYIQTSANDVSCSAGNSPQHKVKVCHRPPGNPTNVQNICIDWNGVPAHVARFRSPNSNPNQGHDSGCEIGECGYNPCD